MKKRGEVDTEVITNLIIIMAMLALVFWFIRSTSPISEVKKVNTNLNNLQDTINFACVFDYLEIEEIPLLKLNGNLSVDHHEICITSQNSAELCRIVLCNTTARQQFGLEAAQILKLIKNSSGYYVRQK
jgi:hypothetical protein